jgi:hypothetical protein
MKYVRWGKALWTKKPHQTPAYTNFFLGQYTLALKFLILEQFVIGAAPL